MSCGIYQILNTINGKCYVGSSIKIENSRWRDHLRHLKSKGHHSSKLQHAWNKYGAIAFEWNILQECDESQLDWLEAFWMARLDSVDNGYNCTRLILEDGRVKRQLSEESLAKRRVKITGRPCKEETKKKISLSNKGKVQSEETRKKNGDAHRGKKQSQEVIQKRSEKLKGKIPSKEAREKMSNAQKNRSEDWKLKLSLALKGKTHSQQAINKRIGQKRSKNTKKKMSEVHKGKICSPETKAKMQLAQQKRRAKEKLLLFELQDKELQVA